MNGNGDDDNTRLRRVEDIVEALAMNQRQLLTAQVLLTGQVEKTQIQVEKTQKQIEETNRTVANLGVRIDQVDAQIEALVKVVDGIIRG